MGALVFAGKKILGIIIVGAGILFGVSFWFSGSISGNIWSSIIGIVIVLVGVVFGIYFWRSADRHV